jgi:hypothetical protein
MLPCCENRIAAILDCKKLSEQDPPPVRSAALKKMM